MNKTVVTGIIGGVLYAVGFIWQAFELIRNILTDTEEMPWQIYPVLILFLAALASFLVIYLLFFTKQKKESVTKRRTIVMISASGVTLLWCGIVFGATISQFLSVMSLIKILKMWYSLLLSPSLLMLLGSLLILIMSVIILVSKMKSDNTDKTK